MNTTATTKTRAKSTPAVLNLGADLSPALRGLETAYRAIQRRFPEAPEVTIVIKRDERAWGHTTVERVWSGKGEDKGQRYEIMISGENLRRGGREVLATLLHEAAHAINLASGVRDVDVNGRHNRKFAERARSLGLDVAESGWHGWTDTSLPSVEGWTKALASVEAGLAKSAVAVPHIAYGAAPTKPGAKPGAAAGGAGPVAPPKRGGRRTLPKAECRCGYSIRASLKVLEGARPTCQTCGEPFVAVD